MNNLDDFEELAWLCLGYAPDTVAEIISEQCDPEEELGGGIEYLWFIVIKTVDYK